MALPMPRLEPVIKTDLFTPCLGPVSRIFRRLKYREVGAGDLANLIIDTTLKGSQTVFALQHPLDMNAQQHADGVSRPAAFITSRSQ